MGMIYVHEKLYSKIFRESPKIVKRTKSDLETGPEIYHRLIHDQDKEKELNDLISSPLSRRDLETNFEKCYFEILFFLP